MEEDIIKLKTLLEKIEQLLPTASDTETIIEKKAQLQSIEKSINSFNRSNLSIPPEIRDAKFRLLSEIDTYKKKMESADEISELLVEWVKRNYNAGIQKIRVTKQQGKKRSNRVFNVTIKNLIDTGYLKPGMEFFRKYHGIDYMGHITSEGTIKTEVNGKLNEYPNPSTPAIAVSGKTQNGWTWWNTIHKNERKKLDYFRQEYLKAKSDES